MRGARLAVLFSVAACSLGPRPPPAPPRQTQLGVKIARFDLSNGLRVVLVSDPQMADVQVTTRYQVGSVDDPPDHPGMAHLVEHLMYQQVLGAQSLFAHLEAAATELRGFTSLDTTTYSARAQPARLAELLSIEAVRVGFRCTSITDSVFAREREVVVNELRQKSAPSELLAGVYRAAYPDGHPYQRSYADTVDSVVAITREQACAFADAHYAPNNAVLVVSGNITQQQVSDALAKFLARIGRREIAAPTPVPVVAPVARSLTAKAPIDSDIVLFAWPVPRDRMQRAQVGALERAVRDAIDSRVKGYVKSMSLGDARAPMFGVIVVPASNETVADVIEGARRALVGLPDAFQLHGSIAELVFDQVHQTAIYNLYATLEDGGDRSVKLADFVLAGQDPRAALADDFEGLRELTRDGAAQLVREHFSFEHAVVVRFEADAKKKEARELLFAEAVHDLGQRRDPPDPSDAHRPAAAATPPVVAATTRTLANGLRVVLMPVTSVPTVELALVFGAGTADEPADKRGAALVAGYALAWDPEYLNDEVRFVAGGGSGDVEVTTDRTTFTARGLDMHIDYLLAGLRRWVREGIYDESTDAILDAIRTVGKQQLADDAIADAWRAALYGERHPYTHAGSLRHLSKTLTAADVARFRRVHFTPDNATLVIAGRFDAALTNRWVDFLFADWTGRAEPRAAPPATAQPASLAVLSDAAQAHLQVAFPATAGDRARRLVAAEMLSELAGDVRHQLGASYGLHAGLAESRLAARYTIDGWVEAPRLADAVLLLRDRIAALRSDSDAAARAFVAARSRVVTRLLGTTGSSHVLVERVARDVELGRQALSDLDTARLVQGLTIEAMTETLAELDFARAAVLLRGPSDATRQAFALLGRTPAAVEVEPPVVDATPARPRRTARRSLPSLDDLQDPITKPRPPPAFTVTVAPAYAAVRLTGRSLRGAAIAGEVGYRPDAEQAVGLHLAYARLSGTDERIFNHPAVDLSTIDIAAFAQANAYGRLWGAVQLGVHIESITEVAATSQTGVGFGISAGIDLVAIGRHHIGACGSLAGALATDSGYGGATLGVAYRLY